MFANLIVIVVLLLGIACGRDGLGTTDESRNRKYKAFRKDYTPRSYAPRAMTQRPIDIHSATMTQPDLHQLSDTADSIAVFRATPMSSFARQKSNPFSVVTRHKVLVDRIIKGRPPQEILLRGGNTSEGHLRTVDSLHIIPGEPYIGFFKLAKGAMRLRAFKLDSEGTFTISGATHNLSVAFR